MILTVNYKDINYYKLFTWIIIIIVILGAAYYFGDKILDNKFQEGYNEGITNAVNTIISKIDSEGSVKIKLTDMNKTVYLGIVMVEEGIQ